MGDASRNPRSPQFKGPLPAAQFGAGIELRAVPSLAAIERFKDVPIEERRNLALSHEDTDIVLVARAQWTTPSAISDQWPVATFDFYELKRMPLLEFKGMAGAAFLAGGMPDFTANLVDPTKEERS